jgi:hypothetical protein
MDDQLVYLVGTSCVDCAESWLDGTTLYLRPTSDGGVEVTPIEFLDLVPIFSLAPTSPPPPQPTPAMTVDTTTLVRGQPLTVTVTAFLSAFVLIESDGGEIPLGPVDLDETGSGTLVAPVPRDAPLGPANLIAEGVGRDRCEDGALIRVTVVSGPGSATAFPSPPATDTAAPPPLVRANVHADEQPTPTPTPTDPEPPSLSFVTGSVNASAVVDKDGTIGTDSDELDWDWVSGWQFAADFATARVDVARPITDQGDASWQITYDEATRIVITEHVPDGYALIDVRCQWSPDDMTVVPLAIERDGTSISWTAPVGTWFEHGFWCIFVNVVEAKGESPTPPPTDTAPAPGSRGADPRRVVLVGFAALVAGMLVLRTDPAARGRP